jgi:hypothetical protein
MLLIFLFCLAITSIFLSSSIGASASWFTLVVAQRLGMWLLNFPDMIKLHVEYSSAPILEDMKMIRLEFGSASANGFRHA